MAADANGKVHYTIRGNDGAHDTFICSDSSKLLTP